MKAQLGNYIHEIRYSNYIRQNTTKQEHTGHVAKLNKLVGKYEKACSRLERLRQLRMETRKCPRGEEATSQQLRD